jgi:serine protease Do
MLMSVGVRSIFSGLVCLLLIGPTIQAQSQASQPASSPAPTVLLRNDPLHVFSQSVQELSSQVTKSVVQVLTIGYGLSTDHNSDSDSDSDKTDTSSAYLTPQRGVGAGVILTSDGYVVTNAHVVEGARKIRVRLQGMKQEMDDIHGPLEAKLVGVDQLSDVAVLKINMENLPALQFADSSQLKQGEIVFAFGSPLGLENSVTMGVISATERQIDPDNPAIYIQTDAPINPGNSGGPLVDVDGKVVGINTFILSESGGNEGLGFAIPSNVVKNIYEQLRTQGHVHRGEIGVAVRSITPDLLEGLNLPTARGVLLEDVTPDSPAAKAGLKVGDVVTDIGGKRVSDVRQFALDLMEYKVGQTTKIGVLRGDKKLDYSVTLIERADDPQRFADLVTGSDNLVPQIGVVGVSLNGELKQMLPDLRISSGVVVAAKTRAAELLGQGPELGDVIHGVNGHSVKDVAELRQRLREVMPGAPIVLQIERDGDLSYLVLESE